MTKKEFIEKFHLTKCEKIGFIDGRKYVERTLYRNNYGAYVFYDNDLISVKITADGMGHLMAAYSWYH